MRSYAKQEVNVPKSQSKGSKKQDNPDQSARRDVRWQRGKDRRANLHAAQLRRQAANKSSTDPSPWEQVCRKRKESRIPLQQKYLRQHPIHLIK